jgi:hypothetical protein
VADANLQWVTWQVRMTADAAQEWLDRVNGVAPK